PVEDRRAGDARLRHLRAVHEAVDDEGVLPLGEELRQADLPRAATTAAGLEQVVLRHLAAQGQAPALRRHGLDAAPQLDLRRQQLVAGLAVGRALSRESDRVLGWAHDLLLSGVHEQDIAAKQAGAEVVELLPG